MADSPPVSSVFYFYADVNGEKYPGQITLSAPDLDAHMAQLDRITDLFQTKADEDGVKVVPTFEPREVSGGSRNSSAPAAPRPYTAPQPAASGPVVNCPIHMKPLTTKINRKTNQPFTSCSEKNADGTYCNWKEN